MSNHPIIKIPVLEESATPCVCAELSKKLDRVMAELQYFRSLKLDTIVSDLDDIKSLLRQQVKVSVLYSNKYFSWYMYI